MTGIFQFNGKDQLFYFPPKEKRKRLKGNAYHLSTSIAAATHQTGEPVIRAYLRLDNPVINRNLTLPVKQKDRLIDHINKKLWYRTSLPSEEAIRERGTFYASSYREAEFYGRPLDDPFKVQVKNPLIGDNDTVERYLFGRVLGKTDMSVMERFTLDKKMKEAALARGFDSIAIISIKGLDRLVSQNVIPTSIELNVFSEWDHDAVIDVMDSYLLATVFDSEKIKLLPPDRWSVRGPVSIPITSASSIQLFGGKIYVIGDDSPFVLVLKDSGLEYRQEAKAMIFKTDAPFIPKAVKPDTESSVIIGNTLLIIGSGSTPNREKLLFFDTTIGGLTKIESSKVFFDRLKVYGLKEPNIEGAALIKSQKRMLLSSRGHDNNRHNFVVTTTDDFYDHQDDCDIKIIEIILPNGGPYIGISDLCYVPYIDTLFFTATTEGTANTYDDGAIGDSYIGWIKNMSLKWWHDKIEADELQNLSRGDQRLKGQKVEGIALKNIDIKGEDIEFLLVTDNDDHGHSGLFELTMNTRPRPRLAAGGQLSDRTTGRIVGMGKNVVVDFHYPRPLIEHILEGVHKSSAPVKATWNFGTTPALYAWQHGYLYRDGIFYYLDSNYYTGNNRENVKNLADEEATLYEMAEWIKRGKVEIVMPEAPVIITKAAKLPESIGQGYKLFQKISSKRRDEYEVEFSDKQTYNSTTAGDSNEAKAEAAAWYKEHHKRGVEKLLSELKEVLEFA